MQLTNLTRANEIGANCYCLDFDGDGRIVLDAGMHPRADGMDALPELSLLKVDSVDAIMVSHGHHDHIGALPVLSREQPTARIFMSEPTYFLADPLLHNSVEIMKKQRAEHGIQEYPLFSHRELQEQALRWQACGLDREWSFQGYPDPENEPLTFTFYDAGHILGSVATEINHRGRKMLYTGDVNFAGQTLMQAADLPKKDIDTLIIETTRGAQPKPAGFSREGEIERLLDSILRVFDRGGAVMIPIFAMGKTQEMLALLHFKMKERVLPFNPIYIGGLSRAFTQIYDKLAGRSRRNHQRLQLLEDIQPQVMDGRLARELKPKKGHLYLISSGMMTERTLSNTYAQEFLSREQHAIFFVGYCDPESPAGRLRATPKGESVVIDPLQGPQPVLCDIDHFDFTAHAQREDILDYILTTNPRTCVLVHGDPPALEWFKATLAERAPGMKVIIPPPGKTIEI